MVEPLPGKQRVVTSDDYEKTSRILTQVLMNFFNSFFNEYLHTFNTFILSKFFQRLSSGKKKKSSLTYMYTIMNSYY